MGQTADLQRAIIFCRDGRDGCIGSLDDPAPTFECGRSEGTGAAGRDDVGQNRSEVRGQIAEVTILVCLVLFLRSPDSLCQRRDSFFRSRG